MDYKAIIDTLDSVINNSELTPDKKSNFDRSLTIIKKRTKDPNIYLGIVGEFSSGKSTLINALIGADFFVTNAIQGTTTVITKLAYSDSINFVLKYKSGKELSYKQNKNKMLELYLPEEYHKISGFSKFMLKLKGLLHFNKCDKYFHKVFDIVTTSNDISAELDEVVVYYPSPILKDGLVIVDTPGTDSLNLEHTLITQRAIRDICDLALVVIPAIVPLSMTLANFIDENLRDNIGKCRFIITKIELLQREIERTSQINGVTKRIEKFLDIDQPVVIPAPTLTSLEYRNIVDKVEYLNHLSDNVKKELTDQFIADITKMKEEIQLGKDETINDKIKSLVTLLNIELSNELETQSKQLEEDLQQTKLLRAKPLADFMTEFYDSNEVYTLSYIESCISNRVANECDKFKNYVNRKINDAQTKDDAQNTMNESSTISYGDTCFNCCYNTFSDVLDETKESFENNFKNFKEQFTESYGIEAIDFTYELNNDPSWKRKFDFSYDKSGLTTFFIFRWFKSLQSVKQQMIDDVNPKINSVFSNIENHYLSKSKQAYSGLSKQMGTVKSMFVSKYQKIINQRIADSDKKEMILQSKINNLTNQLNALKNINL